MIASRMQRLIAFCPRLVCRRTVYSSWQGKMTMKEDKHKEFIRDLWHRRALLGPDDPKPRAKDFLWNYGAELFAFGKRLGEDFQMETLRRAFRHASYKHEEKEDGTETPAEAENAIVADNGDLIRIGDSLLDSFVPAYLRYHFRRLPEEGICAITAYLCSDSQLAYLAKNVGMSDLTLSEEFPVAESTMAATFKAVVGALAFDQGEERAEYFVQDFVLTELIDMDINEIFYVKDPTRILEAVLKNLGQGPAEPRILRQTGTFTVTPTYVIGFYANGQLLGQSPGETVDIAEEMAARECLKKIWGTDQAQRLPLTFGSKTGRELNLDSFKKCKNESLRDIAGIEGEADLVESAFEEEPLRIEEMHQKFKNEIEPAFGRVYRRRFKHAFYSGSLRRRCRRPFIEPNVKTI